MLKRREGRRLATIAASRGDDHDHTTHAHGGGDRPNAHGSPGQDEEADAVPIMAKYT